MTKYIIGIDIGGSKIIAALVKSGKIFYKLKIPTPKSRKEFCDELRIIIERLIKETSEPGNIKKIGCGIAGVIDMKNGVISNAPNLKFLNNFNIKKWLRKEFRSDVRVDNDARCFLRAEYMFGAGRGYKNLVGITFGTGVGGGIIVNGKLIYGANDSAGELGHMMMDEGKDLETLTVKQARRLKFSKTAIEKFKKNLNIGLANIINILDPEVTIIGGGAAKNAKNFLSKAKTEAAKFIVSPKSRKNVKILIGKLGDNAGAIGAAALFYEQ